MIRPCTGSDLPDLYDIINDGAQAYRGVIPDDRWHEPYMSRAELEREIAAGVAFYAFVADEDAGAGGGRLAGVMGIQDKGEVALIRHAYVRTSARRGGIGGQLLRHLLSLTQKPILIGTWAAADWAVRFYEKHGFRLTADEEKVSLLRRYWDVPARQIETSVVLRGNEPSAPSASADAATASARAHRPKQQVGA